MFYLSQAINKKLYLNNQMYGKVIDFAVADSTTNPSVEEFVIKRNGKKIFAVPHSISFSGDRWTAQDNIEEKPYKDSAFFLVEDLLDKQVIDINGKRLVRVNDVLLKENGKMKADGIEIGFAAIFRRLGLPNIFGLKNITLPWTVIEAFDYQTGTVQIKLTQNKLNTFHPAEIADILEDAGTKERLGIVESLDVQQAAAALEEADEETQSAILEQVSTPTLKKLIERMRLSELADVINTINPFTGKEILKTLGTDRASKLQKLLVFEDDEAGGMMDISFYEENAKKTVEETLQSLAIQHSKPESLVLVNDKKELIGVVNVKNIINFDTSLTLADLPRHEHWVKEVAPFSEILKIFAEYNIRLLPVIDETNHVLGVIKIDQVLEHLQEEEEKENVV